MKRNKFLISTVLEKQDIPSDCCSKLGSEHWRLDRITWDLCAEDCSKSFKTKNHVNMHQDLKINPNIKLRYHYSSSSNVDTILFVDICLWKRYVGSIVSCTALVTTRNLSKQFFELVRQCTYIILPFLY